MGKNAKLNMGKIDAQWLHSYNVLNPLSYYPVKAPSFGILKQKFMLTGQGLVSHQTLGQECTRKTPLHHGLFDFGQTYTSSLSATHGVGRCVACFQALAMIL